jgi:hypothetical protein
MGKNKSNNRRGLPGLPRSEETKDKLRLYFTNRPKIDMSGLRFGKLAVLGVDTKKKTKGCGLKWICKCDCGELYSATGRYLRIGQSVECKSCRRKTLTAIVTTHGLCKNHEYCLWHGTRSRCIKLGIEFSITPQDIVIPERCPVFGFVLKPGKGKFCEESPSVDRINPKLGYTKENIWIISWKANRIKTNATPEELMIVANAVWEKTRKRDAA